jgi:hypothetical protein
MAGDLEAAARAAALQARFKVLEERLQVAERAEQLCAAWNGLEKRIASLEVRDVHCHLSLPFPHALARTGHTH